MDQTQQEAIEQFVIQAARAAHVHITQVKLLSGGAVQENWLLDLSIEGGPHQGNLKRSCVAIPHVWGCNQPWSCSRICPAQHRV